MTERHLLRGLFSQGEVRGSSDFGYYRAQLNFPSGENPGRKKTSAKRKRVAKVRFFLHDVDVETQLGMGNGVILHLLDAALVSQQL